MSRTASWAAPTASSPAASRRIATGFPRCRACRPAPGRSVHTGNPVRPAVLAAARDALSGRSRRTARCALLVFGGSQGARVMSEVVPAAIERLPPGMRAAARRHAAGARRGSGARPRRLRAARRRRRGRSRSSTTCPQRMADAHLVVSRSGASTVAELAAIGRPVDPGAAAGRARPGPGGQRRPLGGDRRGRP